MKFSRENTEHSKPFFALGFLISYIIFSTVLTFMLKFFKDLENKYIPIVFLSTAVLILLGGVIKKWLE